MKKNIKYYIRNIGLVIASLAMALSAVFGALFHVNVKQNITANAEPVKMVGIDVSEWNQEIDWDKVKAAGVEFAIIRMFGHNKNTNTYRIDPYFERNVTEAQKRGIHLGAYFFSYAPTLADIPNEAEMVMDLLANYPGVFSFPIVFDAEDGDYTDDPNVEGEDIYDIGPFAGDACKTFCDILKDNGYYPMVYSYDWYFESKIGMEKVKDFDLWQASYPRVSGSTTQIYAGTGPSEGKNVDDSKRTKLSAYDDNVTMWQYTGAGKIDGIYAGDGGAIVDLNVCYVDYTQIIPTGGYNGYNQIFVDEDSIAKSSFASGGGLPVSHLERNPNVYIKGLGSAVNDYRGLENYGNNKENILINGRTWSKWEEMFGQGVLKNMWVYGVGGGNAYLGLEIGDTSKLYVRGQNGGGETLDTIVLKRGFEIVNVSSNQWDSAEISDSSATGVVGRLKENIILIANNKGGFNVILDADSNSVLEGYTFSRTVTLTASANIRSGPDTTYSVLGVGSANSNYKYLNETQNTKWLKIDYNGQTGWVSNVNATLSEVEITARNGGWTDGSNYAVTEIALFASATHPSEGAEGKMAFKFLNSESEAFSFIELRYSWERWSPADEYTMAFLGYFKINGVPVLQLFPNAELMPMDQGNGMSLENIEINNGDVISIDQGAVFTHGDMQMATQYQFDFTFNGATFDISKGVSSEHNFKWVADGNTHYKKCEDCGFVDETTRGEHNYQLAHNEEHHYQICQCGHIKEDSVKNHIIVNCKCACTYEKHEYTYAYDETGHWQCCKYCSVVGDREGHAYQPSYDGKNHYHVCVCGSVEAGTTVAHNYQWEHTENEHYKKCDCGYVDESTRGEHQFEKGVCTQCLYQTDDKDKGCNSMLMGGSAVGYCLTALGAVALIKGKKKDRNV